MCWFLLPLALIRFALSLVVVFINGFVALALDRHAPMPAFDVLGLLLVVRASPLRLGRQHREIAPLRRVPVGVVVPLLCALGPVAVPVLVLPRRQRALVVCDVPPTVPRVQALVAIPVLAGPMFGLTQSI